MKLLSVCFDSSWGCAHFHLRTNHLTSSKVMCVAKGTDCGFFRSVNRELSGVSTVSDILPRWLPTVKPHGALGSSFRKVTFLAARPGKLSNSHTILTGVKFHKVGQRKRQHAWESYPDVSMEPWATLRTRWSLPYLSIVMELQLRYTRRIIFFPSPRVSIKLSATFNQMLFRIWKPFQKSSDF